MNILGRLLLKVALRSWFAFFSLMWLCSHGRLMFYIFYRVQSQLYGVLLLFVFFHYVVAADSVLCVAAVAHGDREGTSVCMKALIHDVLKKVYWQMLRPTIEEVVTQCVGLCIAKLNGPSVSLLHKELSDSINILYAHW